MKNMRFLLFFFMPIQILLGQENHKPIVKSGTIKAENELDYFENDRHGNTIFSLNEGMNGPLTMIFAGEYDSLNREIKSYNVHSNLGFDLSEKIYESRCIKSYNYKTQPTTTYLFDIENLKKIKTRGEFIQMEAFRELEAMGKYLRRIELLDSANNIVKIIHLSEGGDTIGIDYHRYNSNNQETFFHNGTIGDESWIWDIYTIYNSDNKKIKSFRISSLSGIKDTTDVYNYIYDDSNRLISVNYYLKNAFQSKTDYHYDSGDLVVRELFYNGSETELDFEIIYTYDEKGNTKEKIEIDYQKPKNEQKAIYKYDHKYEYW